MSDCPTDPSLLGLPPVEAVHELPPEARPAFIAYVAALQAKAASKLTVDRSRPKTATAKADTLLTVRQAAERLGTTTDWLYRNAHSLPFSIRLGTRQLRFSASGIDRWTRIRQGGVSDY